MKSEKSEVCPFSTWSDNSSWNPTTFTGNQNARVNITPCLLGIILDRSLTFNAHLKKLTASLASSIHIIRARAYASWGWRCSTRKMAFHTFVYRKPDYEAPAWQPWLSDTNRSSLNCLQNHSLQLITGQLVSTPIEALKLEADVQSYRTCSKRLILKANEKALGSTDNHPKRIALDVNIPQCLQNRSSFHRKAEELSTLLPPDLQHRIYLSPPRPQSSSHVGRIFISVPGITGRADGNNIKRQCRLSTIASYQADCVIYNDVSASGGTRNEGAAAVVTRGPPLQRDVVTTIKTKGRTFTSSYEEEAAAMKSALSWALTNANHDSITVLFCIDSKSLCEALISSKLSIPSTTFRLQSLSSGSLAILSFQVTISPTKQLKKPPSSPKTQFFLFLYLVPFKSLTRRFVTLHQYTNGLLLYTNIEGLLETQNRSTTEKTTS